MKPKIWFALALLLLLIIVVVQNTLQPPVEFHIFFWKISMSQVILVPLAVVIGFLFGYFIAKGGMKKLE